MSKYGFTALPRDINVVLNGQKNVRDPDVVLVDDIELPDTPLAKKVLEYAKRELGKETYNQYTSSPSYTPLPPFSFCWLGG